MLLKWAVRLRARAFYFRILFPLAAWMRSGRVLNGERYSCCAARHLPLVFRPSTSPFLASFVSDIFVGQLLRRRRGSCSRRTAAWSVGGQALLPPPPWRHQVPSGRTGERPSVQTGRRATCKLLKSVRAVRRCFH